MIINLNATLEHIADNTQTQAISQMKQFNGVSRLMLFC